MDCLASRRADPTNTPTSQRVPASPPPPTGSPALHTAPEADQRNRANAALREEALESRNERAERVGDDGEEARSRRCIDRANRSQPWIVPPPSYFDSLHAPPALV